MKRMLLYNAIILVVFCAVWYWGFFMSERWIRIIDFGVPWPWLGGLFAASYTVSFFSLRKHSEAAIVSLLGPLITEPVFSVWIAFCAIKFDPFY